MPVQVVITLQPTPDVPDDLPLDTTVVEENYTDAIDPTLTVTEGTGDFSPVSEILDSEEDVVDTSKADLANVDEPDEQLIDSSAGSGSTKQMVTTSEAQNKAEPYYFRLENGWLIIESQQEVKVITILDASLRLMRKEEGTNKILLDLPSGNYFVTVKFADGKEIIESAHF